MKRVLLISPPGTVYGTGILRPIIPLGLMYLASYVREKIGEEVKILDALTEGIERVVKHRGGRRYGMSEAAIGKVIREYKPDVVGVSNMYTAYEADVVEICRLVKKINSDILTVVGGAHVSINPKAMTQKKDIDVAVYGEGEITFGEIVAGKSLGVIKGIVYKEGRKLVMNQRREPVANLDDLPFPAWDMIEAEKYCVGNVFHMREPAFQIVSSRGCPNHCLYCSIHSLWEHRWRGRSAKNVVDELEFLNQNFGAREFSFQDDSMSVDKERMRKICEEIIKRGLDVKWTTPNGIAHWTLDKKIIKRMKQAGCYRITFGIESGDVETRRWVGKPFDLDQATELIKYANSLGMWTLTTNILGFPYDTREKMMATLDYAIKSEVDLAFFFILGPRPGTPIYEIFKREGWLMKDKRMLFSENVACRTKYFSGEEIIALQGEMYQMFLKKRWFRPGAIFRLINKVRSWEDGLYLARIGIHSVRLLWGLMLTKKVVTSKTLRV